jgi:outer membrane receptor protein involved in Fe transport
LCEEVTVTGCSERYRFAAARIRAWSFKTGVSFLYSNHWNIAAISPQRGSYSFTNKYTGYAYADFLLGLPTSTQVSYPGALAYRNITDEFGVFVQDDFKLTSKLTLNAGIRYDLQAVPG